MGKRRRWRWTPRARRIAWLAAAALLALAAPAVARSAPGSSITCHSGTTIYRHSRIRVFAVTRHTSDHFAHQLTLICRLGASRPHVLDSAAPFTYVTLSEFRRFGSRLGFLLETRGFSNGFQFALGWINLRTFSVHEAAVNDGENAEPGDPLVPVDELAYVIASDGTVALIGGQSNEAQQVAVLVVRQADLSPPRVVYTALHGGLEPRSIALTPTLVTWRTRTGAVQSAPRPAA